MSVPVEGTTAPDPRVSVQIDAPRVGEGLGREEAAAAVGPDDDRGGVGLASGMTDDELGAVA